MLLGVHQILLQFDVHSWSHHSSQGGCISCLPDPHLLPWLPGLALDLLYHLGLLRDHQTEADAELPDLIPTPTHSLQ